ncbi:MAG: 2'-5' RNA ligase family protein [Balneolaceae bacterium]|nr:2'-5' RNA ligase family protein [Balneolaceae bacterium]
MIPDEKPESKYRRIIQGLAEKYQSEAFRPHITLAGVPDWTEERIIKSIEKIAEDSPPLQLSTGNIYCKQSPYQKITLGVLKSQKLDALHQRIDGAFRGNFSKKLYPHLSLLYSRMSCSDLHQEIQGLEKKVDGQILFNRIAFIQCKGTPEDWRTLYLERLV